ncbi:hypothetical protein D1BOALGB6SA_377 [Olavius sp. associated proteobacterium Delta 1]|nr:hypothetical protein D1BOALGB6SA_377 [Olavius sp. associated proteobacterium Delta 1]
MNLNLTIGDLIEVPEVQTVIRLEEGRTRSEQISHSFVFTEEVASHLTVLADSLLQDQGRGFFLQGDFGSGKSHFLAALTACLSAGPGSEVLSRQHAGLSRLKASGRKLLAVDISLIQFRATTSLEQIVVEAIEARLTSAGIPTRLTPRAAFLDHLKNLLKSEGLAAAFAGQLDIRPEEIDAYLRDHPRRSYVEGVRFMKELGLEAPESLVEERIETFERTITAVRQAGFDSLVLIMDELSEFFRSKPDTRGLNDDARTLQLIGELADTEPLWIIAAVQEAIERTGDISQGTLRKIRDRFPVKLVLSSVHIKALIAGRLVKRRPGVENELLEIYHYLQRHFFAITCSYEDFLGTYPIHPATIALLDGLGDLFSQHRGIVDFVHSRLAGEKSRKIAGILDHPSFELLGPDSIYDHFARRISEFSAFHVYPKYIIPHLDEVIDQILEDPDDRTLARRIIRILVLYNIHPTASLPTVRALTELVSCTLSDHDPDLNVEFISGTILDPLVQKSRFLVKHRAPTDAAVDDVYEVLAQEDPSKTLDAKIAARAAEIPPDDSRLLLDPLAELSDSPSWPGAAILQSGALRQVHWRQSRRMAWVAFLSPGDETSLLRRIDQASSSGEWDFAFIVSIMPARFEARHTAVWQISLPQGPEETAVLREYLAARQISSELRPTNPAEAPLIQPAEEALERLRTGAHQAALDAFYAGNYRDPAIAIEPVIRQMRQFDRLLETAAEALLEDRFPGYREIAPRKVTPTRMLYQRLIDEFVSPGSLNLRAAHARGLSEAIEGLAAPLGLAQLRAGTYVFAPGLQHHPLLAEVFGLLNAASQTKVADVLQILRTGRYGLPEDTALFLLAALAHGGLITPLKHSRPLPLEFLRLHKIQNADALAPGEVIGKHDRETLVRTCGFLSGSGGWESFGLRQQREAWQELIKFREWVQKACNDLARQLAEVAHFSAFESFDLDALRVKLETLRLLADEIKVSYAAREGLERFLKAWRESGFGADDIERLKKMRRFLTRESEQFVFVNHYLQHGAVAQAASEDHDLTMLRADVMQLLALPERMIMQAPGTAPLNEAFDQFRAAYADHYARQHAAHYSCFEKKSLSRFARRACSLLKRLSSIEVLDRPAGLADLFRQIGPPRTSLCKRNLGEELMRSPVCSCGFVPGQTPPPARLEDPESAIETCLNQYLTILKAADVREALEARAFAMSDADPETAGRLRRLKRFLADTTTSATALLDLLDEDTAGEISRALAGRILIEKRSLKDLVSRLGGRRLAPGQVRETVAQWISKADENTVIAVEDAELSLESGPASLSWWPLMHPELHHVPAYPGIREIEAALERQHPAAQLRQQLLSLDDRRLIRFICEEPFHIRAIGTAWLVLAERILSAAHWPDAADIYSRYADLETAGSVQEGLRTLRRICELTDAPLPDKLRLRVPLSEIWVNPWASRELRSLVLEKIQATARRGDEWLATLPAVEPIDLSRDPLVLLIDGVSPDIWLETLERLEAAAGGGRLAWQRLDVAPKTAVAVAALFGFNGDALDEFHARDIDYHQIKGDEAHGLADLLPDFAPGKPTVIRVSRIDDAAHAARLRLAQMPGVIAGFLNTELTRLLKISAAQNRQLIITTDHGLSLSHSGLSHGSEGVFEQAVFQYLLP